MSSSRRGAPAAYRGYRLQALYTLHRLLNAIDETTTIQPEGKEDIDIFASAVLSETIQVKSYSGLALSDLEPEDPRGFFHRALRHMADPTPPQVLLVNFGPIGPELRNAWLADGPDRVRIEKKLGQLGYSQDQKLWLFTRVTLLEVDEATLRAAVGEGLRGFLVGVDPNVAFDLLNFWLYLLAETRERVTRDDLLGRTQGIARFLAEQHAHHKEWYTSIIPLDLRSYERKARDELVHEFSLGVSVRYEHIIADLDLLRPQWIDLISAGFEKSNVVVIHAASGQGKTTLAYRYLSEHFPSKYTFQIDLINDRAHALSIERAISGFAQMLRSPLAIYIDVSPRDTDWPELVRRLALNSSLRVLITIREEDLKKALLSEGQLSYSDVELVLRKDEAQEIFNRFASERASVGFIDFDEAWSRFGCQGPLLEFVYLLTQTETLRERLKGQIERINQDVDRGLRPVAEVRMLRVIAIFNSLEARVDVRALARHFPELEIARVVQKLEREYLLRLSSDQGAIESLHPVRSEIIAELLCDPILYPKDEIASSMLELIYEEDVENVAFHIFVGSVESTNTLLASLRKRRWKTWAGAAGCLRAQAWTIVRDYVAGHADLIASAYSDFGKGFSMWLDFDLSGVADANPTLRESFSNILSKIPEARRDKIEAFRGRKSPTSNIFDSLRDWLAALPAPDESPKSSNDWAGVAQIWFWGGHFDLNRRTELAIADDHLAKAVKTLTLSVLAEVLHALSDWNAAQYDLWLEQHLRTLQERLAEDYGVFAITSEGENITLHYVLDPSLDDWHGETLERVWIARNLFPRYLRYGAQAYGHQLGDRLPLVYDPTHKDGIPRDMLPPAWKVYLNSTAIGLATYRVRLGSWNEYASLIIGIRRASVKALGELLRQIRQISTGKLSLSTYLQESLTSFSSLERQAGLLPKTAVDPWGFTLESRADNRPGSSPESAGALTMPSFRNKSFPVKRHQVYLDLERKYLGVLQTFLDQAVSVVLVRVATHGRNIRDHAKILATLRERGLRIDLARLSVRNLYDAFRALALFQHQFASKFLYAADAKTLQEIEAAELQTLGSLWPAWYFFAEVPRHRPKDFIADSLRQFQAARNELLARFRRACKSASILGAQANILTRMVAWDERSAVWVQLNVDDPSLLYKALELLLAELRLHINLYDFTSLISYAAEELAELVVVCPTIRGKSLRRQAWVLHLRMTVLNELDDADPSSRWKFIPKQVAESDWNSLALDTWNLPDVALALDLEASLGALWANVARVIPVLDGPDEWEPHGVEVLRRYLTPCLDDIAVNLEAVIAALDQMSDRFMSLDDDGLAEYPNWISVAQEFRKLFLLVASLDGTNVMERFAVADIRVYEPRVHEALELCQEMVLWWIADALPLA